MNEMNENHFNGFLDPKNLGKDTKFIHRDRCRWSYIGCNGATAVLDAILN